MEKEAREAFMQRVLRMADEAGMKAEEFRKMLFEMNMQIADEPEADPAYSSKEAMDFFAAAQPLLRYMRARRARGLNPMNDECVIVTPERAVMLQDRFCLPCAAIDQEENRGQ